jgi:hypothetical protein
MNFPSGLKAALLTKFPPCTFTGSFRAAPIGVALLALASHTYALAPPLLAVTMNFPSGLKVALWISQPPGSLRARPTCFEAPVADSLHTRSTPALLPSCPAVNNRAELVGLNSALVKPRTVLGAIVVKSAPFDESMTYAYPRSPAATTSRPLGLTPTAVIPSRAVVAKLKTGAPVAAFQPLVVPV